MSIFQPDKVIMSTLAAGVAAIRANYDVYLADIFDVDIVGAEYIAGVKEYLQKNKIVIVQALPMEDTKLPGFFVLPATGQLSEAFVEDLIDTEIDEATDEFVEEHGVINQLSTRIIIASTNGDLTLWLEAIVRYILLQAREVLDSDFGFKETAVTVTDLDPYNNLLPQHVFNRTVMVSCKGIDSHTVRLPLLEQIVAVLRTNMPGFDEHISLEV